MAVCEKCGTTYRPTTDASGCPACARGSAPRRAAAREEAPDSVAVPPRKPAAQRPAVRPVRASAASQTALGEDDASRGESESQGESTPASRHRGAAERHAPVEEPILDDAARYGMFAALGLALVVGLVCLFVFRNKAAQKRALAAYEAEVAQIYEDLQGVNLKDPAAAERLIEMAGKKESTWQDHDLAPDIASLVSRARSNLTAAKERSAALERFTTAEAELKKSELPSERLKDLRRQLEESEVSLADGGAELVARVSQARLTADRLYATRLVEEARAVAREAGSSPRSGLVRLQPVEDELKALLDRAFTAKNAEMQAFYTPLYQKAIEESDRLATALFQAEGEGLQWVDCLVPPQDGQWNPSKVRGFSHLVQGGALQIVGPDLDAGKMAVISIGDREQWRHFQADIEFVIEKGDLDLFLRLGRGPNQNTLAYPLRTTATSGVILQTGKKYAARVSVIGSQFSVRFVGEDIDTRPYVEDVRWTMTRKGAIGLVVSPETRVKFTRFKVRELR